MSIKRIKTKVRCKGGSIHIDRKASRGAQECLLRSQVASDADFAVAAMSLLGLCRLPSYMLKNLNVVLRLCKYGDDNHVSVKLKENQESFLRFLHEHNFSPKYIKIAKQRALPIYNICFNSALSFEAVKKKARERRMDNCYDLTEHLLQFDNQPIYKRVLQISL